MNQVDKYVGYLKTLGYSYSGEVLYLNGEEDVRFMLVKHLFRKGYEVVIFYSCNKKIRNNIFFEDNYTSNKNIMTLDDFEHEYSPKVRQKKLEELI